MGWMPLGRFRFDPAASEGDLIEANWALYCGNYLEEFHTPHVHGASLEALDYRAYRTECFRWGNLQFEMGKGEEPGFDLPSGHPDEDQPVLACYFWLFPNTMLNFYPWGLSPNVVQPLGGGRTRVSFRPRFGGRSSGLREPVRTFIGWRWRMRRSWNPWRRGWRPGATDAAGSRRGGRWGPTTSTFSWRRRWETWLQGIRPVAGPARAAALHRSAPASGTLRRKE